MLCYARCQVKQHSHHHVIDINRSLQPSICQRYFPPAPTSSKLSQSLSALQTRRRTHPSPCAKLCSTRQTSLYEGRPMRSYGMTVFTHQCVRDMIVLSDGISCSFLYSGFSASQSDGLYSDLTQAPLTYHTSCFPQLPTMAILVKCLTPRNY